MKYRKLGRTNLEVSEIAMGCEGFDGKSQTEVDELIDAMHTAGMNFIDLYTPDPAILKAIGSAIHGRRDAFILQSHICSVYKDGQYKRSRETEEVKEAFFQRLEQMQTDHFEIGMIHYVDSLKDWQLVKQNVLPMVKEWKKQGLIRYIGLSSHNPEAALAALDEIDVLMFSINPCYDLQPGSEDIEKLWADESYEKPLLNMDPSRKKLYEECAVRGIGIDVMKAFGGGDLLHADLSEAKVQLTPYECISYALSRPAVAAVMTGSRSIDELRQNAAYEEAPQSQKDYTASLMAMPKISWRGHCMYCGHCAPCPAGINVADVTKLLNLAQVHASIPETVNEHYMALDHHASECIQCRACDGRCPFHVEASMNMKKAAALFGK